MRVSLVFGVRVVLISSLFISTLLSGCASTKSALPNAMLGAWQMEKIVMDGINDVSAEQNPEQNRFIVFNDDQTFESGGDPYGKNTGSWSFDKSSKTLYLDSDAGEDDDSYWIVTIDKNQMHWQGTHFEFNSRFSISHVRVKK